ncbi:MAG TPA: ferritin-like domain-containing protein [Myxococcota bacterium]|nr:ferritin-like domain-containing protein [Myxococcota bacterium]
MIRHPLLTTLLLGLGLSACKVREEENQCLLANDDLSCPSIPEAEALLLGDNGCGDRTVSVDGEGVLSGVDSGGAGSDTAGGSALCCYPVTVMDNPRCEVMEGRPFVQEGALLAEVEARADWCSPMETGTGGLSLAQRQVLAVMWSRKGQEEHGSVAAFAKLVLELMGLGAPPELLAAVQVAMGDEIRHAKLCFSLASRYGAAPVGPADFPLPSALELHRDLRSLALATVTEGCIGETLAAMLAAEAAQKADDPAVRRTLLLIHKEEERHAALAWRVLAWALEQGDDALRAEVADLFAQAKLAPRPERRTDPDLIAHGALDSHTENLLCAQGMREVILPCAAALLTPREHRQAA